MQNKDDQRPKAPSHQITVVAHMMTPGVVQIPGDVSVTEAASLLEREQMPCLLVKDTESRFGLMTPTDIVKKVVAQGLEPDEIEVRTIMTRPVQFIEYDRAVEDASTLMMSTGTPILIVTKQDQPVGVLTVKDLVLSPKRCLTRIPATISVMDGESPGAQHHATIIQLSHIGALVESPALLFPGTKVVVSFSLPTLTSPLTVRGTILDDYELTRGAGKSRVDSTPGVDIQFTNLSPADQSRIKAWVLQNSPESSDLP
ncbi:MAG TPA: CBS domain-containing protein [Nitrospiraceae bacterium]|nr:CBS domain-containing protein [Nitrospiraceae bacterium]